MLLTSEFPEREPNYLFLSGLFNYDVQVPVKIFALLLCEGFIPKGKYIFQKLLRNTIVFRRQHYVCFWSICVTFWYMLSGLINPVDVCETWSNFTWSELLHLTYHHVTLKVKLKTITNQHKLCIVLKYFRKTEVIFKDK